MAALLDQTERNSLFSEDYHTYAAFVLASIVHNFPIGQENALQGSLVSTCLDQLNHKSSPKLKQWLIICLGNLWQNFERARWSGARDMAYEKLYPFLQDPVPEVRAAVVYALGTFISSVIQRTDHANNTDRSIAIALLSTVIHDASPIVRMELIATLQWMVIFFENQFTQVLFQEGSNSTLMCPTYTHSLERNINMKRVSSSNSITNQNPLNMFGSIILKMWNGFLILCRDPFPEVAKLAHQVVQHVNNQAIATYAAKEGTPEKHLISVSLPPSPNTRTNYLGESPPVQNHHINHQRKISTTDEPDSSLLVQSTHNRYQLNQLNTSASGIEIRSRFSDSHSANNSFNESSTHFDGISKQPTPIVTTNYIKWSVGCFAKPSKTKCRGDPDTIFTETDSNEYLDRLSRIKRNVRIRDEGMKEQRKVIFNRLEHQIYNGRTQSTPITLKLHPYEPMIAVAYKDRVALHDWTTAALHTLVPAKVTQPQPMSTSKHFVQPFTNQHSVNVSSLGFINEHDSFLVMVGYLDGVIRLWRHNEKDEPTLVTAWHALGDATSKTYVNLVTAWHQQSHTIFTAGDAKYIRLWDAERELKTCDMLTGTESMVTDIACSRNGICAVGCADGSIRLFDKRLPQNNSRIETYCEYNNPVLNICLRKDCESLISAR